MHLLNDERGAVIETIVARTLRQVCYELELIVVHVLLILPGGIQSIGHPYSWSQCYSPKLRRCFGIPQVRL